MAYQRKTRDRWDIETNYGYGWEQRVHKGRCKTFSPGVPGEPAGIRKM